MPAPMSCARSSAGRCTSGSPTAPIACTSMRAGGSSVRPTRRCEPMPEGRLVREPRYVLGRGTLLSLHDFELDALPLGQRLEAAAVDGRMMDEAILRAALRSDEAEALGVVEPLDCSGHTHWSVPVCGSVVGYERRWHRATPPKTKTGIGSNGQIPASSLVLEGVVITLRTPNVTPIAH